jgi:DNA-binding NarL/FixJ family response regulator
MRKTVTAARQPDATHPGAGAIHRRLFDSFNPDPSGQISPLQADPRHHTQRAVLARAARRARPAPRGRAAPLLPALRRLARRKPSPRTGQQVPVPGPAEAAPVLTPRELDVLRLAAQGLTNPSIARHLVLSEHTVHRHLANIFRKLNLSSRAAAAAWAVRSGLV